MAIAHIKLRTLNTLGAIGYISCLFQWFWTVLIFLPWLMSLPAVKEFLGPSKVPVVQQPVIETVTTSGVNPFVSFLGIVLVIAVVVGILYVVVMKIPRSIAKTGEAITHKPVVALTPIVIKHTHLKSAQKRLLSTRLIFAIKMLLVFVPFCLLALSAQLPLQVSFGVAMTFGAILFSWSLLSFVLQFLLARYFKIDYQKVR